MASDAQTPKLSARKGRPDGWSQAELEALEEAHQDGLTVQSVLEVFHQKGESLTEATFRKYVQLGLLPRSRRVGRKGRGSQGVYPATVVRQLAYIRRLMGQGFTMEEIQKEFLFVRGDIEALSRQLDRIYAAIESAAVERSRQGEDLAVQEPLDGARELGAQLIAKLETIERGLTMRARMARAAV